MNYLTALKIVKDTAEYLLKEDGNLSGKEYNACHTYLQKAMKVVESRK